MAYCVQMALPGGGVAIVRLSGKRPQPCQWCATLSTKLCDFVVSSPQQITHKRTCDAPMCAQHAKSVGHDLDYCPEHAHLAPEQTRFFEETA